MFNKIQPFFLIAVTPAHVGSGSELGLVDLPLQREKTTGYPKIEASSLKGCIREAFENSIATEKKEPNSSENNKINEEIVDIIFGPEDSDESFASAVIFTDAKILFFPVKSLKGTFAWITCPFVLKRFENEIKDIYKNEKFKLDEIVVNSINEKSSNILNGDKIVLEEYTFQVTKKNDLLNNLTNLINDCSVNDKIKKDIVVLSDDDFKHFVLTSTEVITRTKIDNITGTVKSGSLWTEEYLPAYTIMYAFAFETKIHLTKEKLEEFNKKSQKKLNETNNNDFINTIFSKNKIIQIGGNRTIGKGFFKINLLNNTCITNNTNDKKEVQNAK